MGFQGVSSHSEGIKDALFQVPSSAQFQFPDVLGAEFRLDPEFRQRVVGLERMHVCCVFVIPCRKRACAVEHDSHDAVSECGSGLTALKTKGSEVASGHGCRSLRGACRQGPRRRKRVKGGVHGPAEDLRPVSEVGSGVNFRPAGGVRGQVCRFTSRKATGTRKVKGGAVTPSLHLEVPETQFVSPGRGLGIRESMGWTKVCETARSGIWVLKGNARARMLRYLPILTTFGWNGNLEGRTRPCGLRQGMTVCVHTSTDMEQQSDHKLMLPSGMWLLVCGAFSHPSCHLGVPGGNVPTGVNLNRHAGSRSCIP